MSDDAKVNEAVKRLRKVRDLDSITSPTERRHVLMNIYSASCFDDAADSLAFDEKTLADAALLLFDETPITEEALRAVGFVDGSAVVYVNLVFPTLQLGCVQWRCSFIMHGGNEVVDPHYVINIRGKSVLNAAEVTIGQLRCLLRGLGIANKESVDG